MARVGASSTGLVVRGTLRRSVIALCRPSPALARVDAALLGVRTVLAWIFTYYGAGKLFGAFHGPGIHRTAQFFATTAHLRPGGLFAVTGGVIELGGAITVGLGLAARLGAFGLLVDQVIAMVTVTWVHGINSLSATPGYEFNLALAALALVVTLLGAGRVSLDDVALTRLMRPTPRP